MDLPTAHRFLCSLSVNEQQELLPVRPKHNQRARKLWGYAAVAAADLSGMLDECLTVADFAEAIAHFETLRSAEVFTGDDWERGMIEVAEAVAAARAMENGSPVCARTES